ncbi:MAG: lipase family protein [Thermocrispum sp.]
MRRLLAAACAVLLTATLGALAAPAAGATPATAAAGTTASPGAVIDSGPLAEPLWSKLRPEAAAATRVKYWSTQTVGGRNRAVQVTGAVFVPKGKRPDGGWPVLSWTHGTVGIHNSCAPSRNPRSDRDAAYLKHWLKQGYAVVSTDYAGLGSPGVHPYLDGRTAAFGAADMVRAARAVTPALARKWAVIGQSQGGHATLFTTILAAEYAPELDFRGGVATGPPSNIELLVSAANPLVPDLQSPELTTYFVYILSGLRTARPDFDVDSYLSEFGKRVVADGERLCYDAMYERVTGVPLGKLLRKPLTDPRFYAALRSVVGVPVSGYDRPFFIGQGAADTAVLAPLTVKLTSELTANGQPVTLRLYPTDHSGTMAASLPDSTPYVAGLFAD